MASAKTHPSFRLDASQLAALSERAITKSYPRQSVIVNEGEKQFSAAMDAISVPPVHPRLSFVFSTVGGHLYGYEAARSIDAQALPLRQIRSSSQSDSAFTTETPTPCNPPETL